MRFILKTLWGSHVSKADMVPPLSLGMLWSEIFPTGLNTWSQICDIVLGNWNRQDRRHGWQRWVTKNRFWGLQPRFTNFWSKSLLSGQPRCEEVPVGYKHQAHQTACFPCYGLTPQTASLSCCSLGWQEKQIRQWVRASIVHCTVASHRSWICFY